VGEFAAQRRTQEALMSEEGWTFITTRRPALAKYLIPMRGGRHSEAK
jgi:hypothetical protein